MKLRAGLKKFFKSTLILPVFISVAVDAMAMTPREAFITAPREVFVSIDSLTRLDMLDYYESGSAVGSRNLLGGTSQVKFLTDNAITVSTSGSSEVVVSLMTAGSDTTLLAVNTIVLPAANSRATVYDRDWKPLPAKVQLPSHNDLSLWMLPQYKDRVKELENMIPFIPAVYSYNNGVLTMTHTLGKVLSTDDYKRVKTMLKPTISYQWTGKKWKEN